MEGMAPLLILTPLSLEYDALRRAFATLGTPSEKTLGRIKVTSFAEGRIALAVGGLGKVDFALNAQHLLQNLSPRALLAVGAAGRLVDTVRPLDVVIGTETVEHDFHLRVLKRPVPRFPANPTLIEQVRKIATDTTFTVHYGPIASGDEDIIDAERVKQVQLSTGGLAVAWEGAGGARAARFYKTPYLEMRAITDFASGDVLEDFKRNIQAAMNNLGSILSRLDQSEGAV